MQQLWFSIYDFSFNYKGNEPAFIDAASFDWAKDLQKNTDTIKLELENYLKTNELQSYFISSIVSKQNSWRTISIKSWGIEQYKNQKAFPTVTALVNKYPQIISVSYNLLEPKSSVLPHCGDTNAIYRCHLGLDIPAGLPDCGFKVKEETKAWQNGEWLIFVDAFKHEAFNNSDKSRYIFVIDVLRDEFATKKMKVCATVRTSLFLQRKWETFTFLKKMPPFFTIAMAKTLRPIAQLSIHLVNLLRIY